MAGNNSVQGLETITFTDNMSFDGTERGGAMTTNGQLWIGSTAGRHVKLGSLTSPGGTVVIGYSSPNITLEAAGGAAFTWTDQAGAFSALRNNGYFITGTATATLPAVPNQGDTIKFFVDTTQILTIQATGAQIIRLGSTVTAAAGTAVSTARGDSVELVFRGVDNCWCSVAGFSGNWTLT